MKVPFSPLLSRQQLKDVTERGGAVFTPSAGGGTFPAGVYRHNSLEPRTSAGNLPVLKETDSLLHLLAHRFGVPNPSPVTQQLVGTTVPRGPVVHT